MTQGVTQGTTVTQGMSQGVTQRGAQGGTRTAVTQAMMHGRGNRRVPLIRCDVGIEQRAVWTVGAGRRRGTEQGPSTGSTLHQISLLVAAHVDALVE